MSKKIIGLLLLASVGLAINAPVGLSHPSFERLNVIRQLKTASASNTSIRSSKKTSVEAVNSQILAKERQLRQAKSPQQAATIAHQLSLAYLDRRQFDRAREKIEVSLKHYPTARAYNTKGSIDLEQGHHQQAASSFKTATINYENDRDYAGKVGASTNYAIALQQLGQYQQAKDVLESLEPYMKEISPDLLANYQRNVGITYATIGDYQQAKASLEKANKATENVEYKAEIAIDTGNMYAVEEPSKARQFYQLAYSLSSDELTKATALANSAIPLHKLGKTDEAIHVLSQAQNSIAALEPSVRKTELSLKTLDSKIYLEKELNRPVVSSRDLQKLQEITATSNPTHQSYGWGYMGAIAIVRNRPAEAVKLNNKAIEIAMMLPNEPQLAYQWQHQQGRAYKSLGQPKLAIESYRNSVDNINKIRADLVAYSSDRQYSFKESLEPIYRELVDLLTDDPTQENLVTARYTIESLQLIELENYFRSSCLDANTEQIDNIDPAAAAIYPITLENKLATIVSTAGEPIQYHQVAVGKAEVEQTINSFLVQSNLSGSRKRRQALGEEIYDWLITPHQQFFDQQKIETLVFVLDSGMRNLPVSAINRGDRYLIEDYKIALAPGLQLISERQKSREKVNAVIGGISQSHQNFKALPAVETEVNQIAQNFSSELLLNQEFTTQKLKQTLEEEESSGILHLATHGQFSSNPEETFVLTWNDRIDVNELDNILKVRQETPKLKPIELLMLSACKTAAGDERAALGLAGVAVKSGARSTIGTLWSVNDASTSILSQALYEGLEKDIGKAESLRQAQLKLLRSDKYSHPYYWGAFVMVGNWKS